MDRGLTKAAGVGRRGRSVGGGRGACPVLRPWEVAPRGGLRVKHYVGNLAGPPLVLKEGEELRRGATGVEVGEPDSYERAVPTPLVRIEVGSGAGPIPMSFVHKTCLARAAN